MTQWRSGAEKVHGLEDQIRFLEEELKNTKDAYEDLLHKYQTLKVQNDRLLKMEAQHQSAKMSLIQKRIILSRAVILVPEPMVIGDRLENSVIKIYRGNNLVIADTAELINCRIIGLQHYYEQKFGKVNRPPATIEIKGTFYNADPHRFAISTYERVAICPGARVIGNICAQTIVVFELTKVRGRLATRGLLEERRKRKQSVLHTLNALEKQQPAQTDDVEEGLSHTVETSNLLVR